MAADADDLQSIEDVQLIPTDWADGDSFQVEFPNGERHTIRLYGADAIEFHVSDKTDARRLRAQRRYFGITYYSDQVPESIRLAKSLGADAAAAVQALLAERFANAIIEHRPYHKLEELTHVPGIGEKRFANLREWLSIQP